jgi:cobyrinic acid a,c-diamide synthase
VQAADLAAENALESRLDAAADLVATHLDLDGIIAAAGPLTKPDAPNNASTSSSAFSTFLNPPGQRVAIAADAAFGFAYAHMLACWRDAGAEILPFSPLADEAPAGDADAIFLPGGYPELHLPRLSTAFMVSAAVS